MSFPQSYLIDILNNVRYAIPVEQASFPDEWRCKDRPKEDQSTRNPGGQGGGGNVSLHQTEGADTGEETGAATIGRKPMGRADLGEDMGFPN